MVVRSVSVLTNPLQGAGAAGPSLIRLCTLGSGTKQSTSKSSANSFVICSVHLFVVSFLPSVLLASYLSLSLLVVHMPSVR